MQQQDDQQQLSPLILPTVEESEVLESHDYQDQVGELGQPPFGNSDNLFEPPPSFDFNTLPNQPFQQPPLDQAWMAIHNGGLFEGSQTPEVAIKSEATLGENSEENWPAPTGTQPHSMEMAPTMQQHEHLAHGELPVIPSSGFRHILPSNGVLIRRAGRRRATIRRHKTPKPPVQLPQLPLDATDREAKDKFLVEARLLDVSYKDIKRLGNFTEAESTLRGRYRTLTKKKEHRVRDPQWTNIDVSFF
jgi:hypothetical protein